MKFTHLHVHSHYSLLDGLAKIDRLLDACQELKMSSIALTDHGSMYGLVEFFQKAKKRGLKPILGSEVYLAPHGLHQKRANIDDRRYHLVLLIKNQTGYRNLVKLTTTAYLDGFYYKPRIDKELLKKHHQGLICLSACLAGEIPQSALSQPIEKTEELVLEYQKIFGPENFYLELQHHPNLPEQARANQVLIEIAEKNKIPLVATNDVHYIKPEEAEAQDILMAIQTDKKTADPDRLTLRADDFSLRPPEQMANDFKKIPQAIENSQLIAQQCSFEFELNKLQLPNYKLPPKETADSYLKKLCLKGIKNRYGLQASQKVFQRLEHELAIIKQTGFASYFLIVQDFVNWAKSQKIAVGPGRGSAAGSIVSYLLQITDIDPLKYDLLFERFLQPERVSMPDIDLDFADHRRDEVINYVRQKYGRNRVAQIITFGTMAARAAIRDVGRAMNYSYNLCDQVAKMVPFGMDLERAVHQSPELYRLYQSDESVKKLIDMAKQLEGVVRHVSTHAAGLVITKDHIDNLVPRQHPTQNDQSIVSQYEMHSIAALGLLKIDFLGLRTLTVIENTLKAVEEETGQKIDWSRLPLNDPKTFRLLQQANTTGVFQMESNGFKKYLKQLKPNKFEDLIAMVALYRPGPMEFIPEFIARKHGYKRIKYLHSKLEPILKDTYGICIYQEQLMRIAHDLAGFTPLEADVLRKAVGKKIKKLLDEQKEKMIEGMIQNQISQKVAEKIWNFIEPFAQYGFNKSHSTCYATIAYQTAYLKAHYPTAFMAALMTSEQNDIDRIAFLVDECRQMKIKVLPPDVNESQEDFSKTAERQIRFGLKAIKNVGHNIVKEIVEQRQKNGPYTSITDFIERLASRDLNKKSLESLIRCGALDRFGERNQLLASLEHLLNLGRESQKAKANGQISLFANQPTMNPSLVLQATAPASKKEQLGWEKELLGLYVSKHPLKDYEQKLAKTAIACKNLSRNHLGKRIKVAGIINRIQKVNTRSGQTMLFVELEDLSDRIEVLVFPRILEQTATAWQKEAIVLVSGRLTERDGNWKILCDKVKLVE